MPIQLIRSHVDSILQLMAPYWSWVNCHMVNYLSEDHWHTFMPMELQNEISSADLIDECFDTVFWSMTDNCNNSISHRFAEFIKFRRQTQKHSLNSFKDIIVTPEEFQNRVLGMYPNPKDQIKINDFLTEKKRHEVEIMSRLVNDLIASCQWKHETIIVDAGDGKGYLSSRLALEYGHKVLGIDSNPTNTENAIKRSKRLKKAWNGLKERAELELKGLPPTRRGNLKQKNEQNFVEGQKLYQSNENDNYKNIDKFITSDMDLPGILEKQFPEIELRLPLSICLTGLHTCGNLAATCLKLFHTQIECKLLCNVGCCYHLLKEQFSEPEFFGNKEIIDFNREVGFPLSKYLQEKQIKLGRNARMLAAQSIERTTAAKELPNISLFYRALLELLICEKYPDLKETVQVGKIRKFNNFQEYVELCRKKYPNLNLSPDIIAEFEKKERNRQSKKFLDLFYIVRMTFAPVLESLILLDRLLYLKELGYTQSFLMPVFDPVISPRNFAIVAIKSE